MKRTSPDLRFVRIAARSPARSMAGPAVIRRCTPISAATIVRERRLAEAGGSVKQQVVERLAASPRRLDKDTEG